MLGGDLDFAVAASNAVISAILKGAPLLAVGSVANRPATRSRGYSLKSANQSNYKEKFSGLRAPDRPLIF